MKTSRYDFYNSQIHNHKDCKKGNKLESNKVSILDLGQQDLSWARKWERKAETQLCVVTEAQPGNSMVYADEQKPILILMQPIDFCTWAHLSFSLHQTHFSLVRWVAPGARKKMMNSEKRKKIECGTLEFECWLDNLFKQNTPIQ